MSGDRPVPDAGRRPGRAELLLLAAVAAMIVLREPGLIAGPRLWAEEAVVYLSGSLEEGVLSLVQPRLGYYSLVPSVSAWLATLFPLDAAATVFTAIAGLVQLAPAAVILLVPSPLWSSPARKAVLLLATVVLPDGELQLNTINAQFHLAAAVGLLLLSEPIRERCRLRAGSLFVACLGSPQACFLLPAFLYRARASGARCARCEAGAVGLGFAAQASAVLAGGTGADRWTPSDPPVVMLKNYLLQFWAHPFVHTDLRFQGTFRERHPGAFLLLGIIALLLVAILLVHAWRAGGSRRWAISGAVLLSVLSLLTSLHLRGGLRYAFPVHVILAALLVDRTWPQRSPGCSMTASGAAAASWSRWAAGALLALLLVVNAVTFRSRMGFAYDQAWPPWAAALREARQAGSEAVRVWPYEGGSRDWVFFLPSP